MDEGGDRREIDLARLRDYGAGSPKQKRRVSPRVAKNAVLAVFAVALVASPWVLLARNKPEPSARPTITPTIGASASASPSESPEPAVQTFRVTSKVCLRLRSDPGVNKPQIGCIEPGSLVRSRGVSGNVDGRSWLFVYEPKRRVSGWVASEFLAPV